MARFDDCEVIGAAIETGAAIVPASVVGNEDSFPLLGRIGSLPITAQFPLLGLLGSLPLPVTWTLRLGPPLASGAGRAGANANGVTDAVRARMQACIAELLAGM